MAPKGPTPRTPRPLTSTPLSTRLLVALSVSRVSSRPLSRTTPSRRNDVRWCLTYFPPCFMSFVRLRFDPFMPVAAPRLWVTPEVSLAVQHFKKCCGIFAGEGAKLLFRAVAFPIPRGTSERSMSRRFGYKLGVDDPGSRSQRSIPGSGSSQTFSSQLQAHGFVPIRSKNIDNVPTTGLEQINLKGTPIDRYSYLSNLRNTNCNLFYRLLIDNMRVSPGE